MAKDLFFFYNFNSFSHMRSLFVTRVVFDTGISGPNDVSPSPSSSVSEGLDLFPDSPLHRYLSTPPRSRAHSGVFSKPFVRCSLLYTIL